ncbi:hypothetical protein [Streptomyces sp. NPDC048442]|uniref:hypothetical protein n=1 Tax=Streptomyces sp. NPDC048442 TaxID=3154823 RepID=UPI003421232E
MTDVPLQGEPLEELMLIGNGKDAEVIVVLGDGRRFVLGLGKGLRVHGCQGLVVETVPWGDISMVVRYSGPGLVISRMRCEVPKWAGCDPEEFDVDLRRWVESGGREELAWALVVEIELAGSPSSGAE